MPTPSGPFRAERCVYARSPRRRGAAVARIGIPVAGGGAWRCRVSLPAVLDRDSLITGGSPAQARALAHEFATFMLRQAGYLPAAPGLPETMPARQRRRLGL